MNIKKLAIGVVTGVLMLGASIAPTFAAGGFDQFGYNNTARVFNGPLSGWCNAKGISLATCGDYGFGSANDKLVMKWNAEWDRGNKEGWTNGPYNAWTDNEFNGNVPGGSGFVWHYKIVWIGNYISDPSLIPSGAYGIWGQFAVIMDQGVDPALGHESFALGTPTGYGAYYAH